MTTLGIEPQWQWLTLPFTAESASVARQAFGSWLSMISDISEDRVDDARLIISELVGNAVRHARPLNGGTMNLAWGARADRPGQIEIEVSDGGAVTEPSIVDSSPSDVSGRGMAIVDALATRWWIDRDPGSSTVHALIAVA